MVALPELQLLHHWRMKLRLTIAGAIAVALSACFAVPAQGDGWRQATAVDGDSLRLANGAQVRLLGIDTPEWRTCGAMRARDQMQRLVTGGVRLVNRSGRDRYGRILAYVRTRDGRDVGTVMLRRGLAVARYDSRDGYPWHPLQDRYRRLDARNGSIRC
jgi:endonuclease YncB( thermonuclease family)